MRESDSCQHDINQWTSFVDEIEHLSFSTTELNIDLSSPEIWEATIKKMKKNSAHGVCGWRITELCMLPKEA